MKNSLLSRAGWHAAFTDTQNPGRINTWETDQVARRNPGVVDQAHALDARRDLLRGYFDLKPRHPEYWTQHAPKVWSLRQNSGVGPSIPAEEAHQLPGFNRVFTHGSSILGGFSTMPPQQDVTVNGFISTGLPKDVSNVHYYDRWDFEPGYAPPGQNDLEGYEHKARLLRSAVSLLGRPVTVTGPTLNTSLPTAFRPFATQEGWQNLSVPRGFTGSDASGVNASIMATDKIRPWFLPRRQFASDFSDLQRLVHPVQTAQGTTVTQMPRSFPAVANKLNTIADLVGGMLPAGVRNFAGAAGNVAGKAALPVTLAADLAGQEFHRPGAGWNLNLLANLNANMENTVKRTQPYTGDAGHDLWTGTKSVLGTGPIQGILGAARGTYDLGRELTRTPNFAGTHYHAASGNIPMHNFSSSSATQHTPSRVTAPLQKSGMASQMTTGFMQLGVQP